MTPFNNKKELNRIIENYISGKATPQEIDFIEAYYQHLDQGENVLKPDEDELMTMANENFKAIKHQIARTDRSSKKINSFYYYLAAAIILITFGVGLFYSTKDAKEIFAPQNLAKKIDVLPGTDKAILTLADGSKIVLDQKVSGDITKHAGVTITKTVDGQLIYKVDPASKTSSVSFNTIQTPKGGQYQVILPDGTKVWLNAASSLKYPEVFVGMERKVELTGEAYFEVAKNKNLPFKVMSKNQNIEVLGTHFNVNTYMDDKAIKTTLIEGSIKISNSKSNKTLKAGEQAVIKDYGLAAITILNDVDTEDETAWKNGQFRFNNAGLKSILNQLERWYDIKIDYTTIPDKRYNGMVPRKAKLSEVLNMLELTGNISFEIKEGRQLRVYTKNKN